MIILLLELIEEINEVLSHQKFTKYIFRKEREKFSDNFIGQGILIKIVDIIQECRDPKDDKILELAISGRANFIISGDKYLLILNPFWSIQIQSVEQFLQNIDYDSP
ncbi:nucleotide binding protein PINc [[Synechococcus] sp. NIES-970]|nr:nucleotide binding protein PINc [[Synechococcus] sp. NIES-970]